MSYLWIFIGGGLGSIARYAVSSLVAKWWGETFPWGTILINITGSMLIGFFVALTATEGRVMVSPTFREFFTFGICGGYTTFSSFSLQTLNLARAGEWLKAGGNVLVSVVCCLVAVWLGYYIATHLNRMKGS